MLCLLGFYIKVYVGLPYQALMALCLKYVVPSEGISLANKELLEVEDNCQVPSSNASGSSHSHGSNEHVTNDEKLNR